MDKHVFISFWSSMVKSHKSFYFFLPDYVYKPTFLRSILTQQAFLEVVVGNVAKYKNTELVGMNDACEDVLSELGQSWGVAENRLSLPAFHELHTQRRARMHRQLNTAYILVQHYQTKASISDADDSMSLMNSFLTKIDPDVSLEEVAPILQKGLLPTIETMIRAWMVASTKALPTSDTVIEPTSRPGMQLGPKKTAAPAKVEPSPVPFIMPLRLIEWTDCLHEKGPSAKIAPGMPHDSQGPRRATNMLMALIYDWLNVQFNEWQAEKAEQELLSGVDQLLEEDATAANGASAGKKKAKKKKNKKAATETDKPLSEASNSGDGKDAAASNGVAATDKDLVAKDAEPAEGGKDDEAMVPIVTAEPVEGVTTTTVSWFVSVFGSYAWTCNIPQSICFFFVFHQITTTVVTTTTTITTTNHPKSVSDKPIESAQEETVENISTEASPPPSSEEPITTPEGTETTKGKKKKKKKAKNTAPATQSKEEDKEEASKNAQRKQPKGGKALKQASTVVVQDGAKLIGVEAFLLGRLESTIGTTTSKDADGYPIVHIS